MAATSLLVVTLAAQALGFSNVNPGQALPEKTLERVGGGTQPYLGKSKLTVFYFFAPGTKNGQLALHKLGELEKEFAGKPVTWTALVSGSAPVAEAKRDAAEASLSAPILRDPGDELYGALGTALTPVVGIADEQHKLLAYLPFTKLQYQDVIRAWVRFGLGEIDQAQLDAVLKPPETQVANEADVAHRYLRLAVKQREKGDLDKALATTRKALELAAELPAAHALLGALLADQGKCTEAKEPLQKALAADPADATALAAQHTCAGDGGRP